jgi:hypothetical protein
MPAEARVTSIWKTQKLVVALALIAFGLWFYVDGKWVWPRANVRWMEHNRLEKEGRAKEWPEVARTHGWKVQPPEKYHDQNDILFQFIFAIGLASIGGLMLVHWARHRGRVIKTEADAVYSPSGTRIPFSAITGLGLKKWESKGYARVRYEIGGRKGEFVLDDYKFERDSTHQILKEIETHLVARSCNGEPLPSSETGL